ncbi:zinc finger protein with KRAB and SCAN domains 1-like [Oncorhynchus masou masou]|uniref:zinc finger protein with KRAB and SCAN domains 1-like n=1 Tax=Oncorhynchus masou masou TaxID=90313 RepID=UPI0031843264
MANSMVFHTQIASIMEVLANAAVAEICKLIDDEHAVFSLEITKSQTENRALQKKLQLLELKVSRERVLASRPSSVKILDRYRGMARGEGHLTGGHRSFVKPAVHNTWRDDQPITVDEGSGTSSQHVILIESADAEAAGPGGLSLVKQEKTERTAPLATENPITAPALPMTRCSIGSVEYRTSSEMDPETLNETHRLLHTGYDHRSDPERLGCPPAPGSEYLPVFHQSQRMVHCRGDGDDNALDTGGDDLSCSYVTEMDAGNISLGLERQTDLSRGDWNQYSSSVYSEGCQDKKVEVIVVDEVTVKVEGDAPPTGNADSHLGDGQSQGRDSLDYRESLETNPNVATHSPLHSLRDRDPVSTSVGPCDSQVLFDQVLNSNEKARDQAQGGGATSGNSKEKRFLCMFCNKGFSCLQKVEIHQRVHTGVKPYSCSQCEKRFSQTRDLKRHQRVHTGEKPYSCPQCEKRFSRQDNLKIHLKVHTGERQFACTQCGKKFTERSYLRIHQQKNHPTLLT